MNLLSACVDFLKSLLSDTVCVLIICVILRVGYEAIICDPENYLDGTKSDFMKKEINERIRLVKAIMQKTRENKQELYHQISLLSVGSIIYSALIRLYKVVENRFGLDSGICEGLVLALTLWGCGCLIGYIYRKWFIRDSQNDNVQHLIDENEYLVIIIMSVLSVSIKLYAEGVIGIVMPITIIVGRLTWLDTKSRDDIRKAIKINNRRIIEMSVLLAIGMVIVAAVICWWDKKYQTIVALFYSVLVCLFGYLRSKVHK